MLSFKFENVYLLLVPLSIQLPFPNLNKYFEIPDSLSVQVATRTILFVVNVFLSYPSAALGAVLSI